MTVQEPREKRRGCRRLALWCVALTGIAIGTGLALFWTGLPQRLAAQYLLASQLDAQVNIKSVSLRNPLVVQGLTLSGQAGSLYGPLLQVGETRVAYDWRPDQPRRIQEVGLDGIRLSLQQQDTVSNFQFLLDRFSGPGETTGDITPWIPERIRLNQLWMELNFPSFYLRMDNLGLLASLDSTTAGTVSFSAPDAAIAWSSAYAPGGPQSGAGTLAFDLDWDGLDADVDAEIDLGALAQARGMASVFQRDGQTFYALSLAEVHLADPLWSAVLADLSPTPVRFETLALEDTDIHFHQKDGAFIVDQASADLRLSRIAIGPDDAPYYDGPLQLAVRGNYGQETKINGTITLKDGVSAQAQFQPTTDGLEGSFGWEPWPRDTVTLLLPPDYAGLLDVIPTLNRLGARGEVAHQPGSVAVSGTLAAVLGDNPPLDIPLDLTYQYDAPATSIRLESEIALDQARVESTVVVEGDQPPVVENSLHAVDINMWAMRFLGKELVPWFSGAISGKAQVRIPPEKPLAVALDLSGQNIRYGDLVLPAEHPVTMTGNLDYHQDTNRVSGKASRLTQEGFLDLTAATWSFDVNKAALNVTLDSTLSLDAIAALFDLADLYGNSAIQGTLSIGPEATRLEGFTATSEDLIYGDWSVPYGLTLNLAGSLVYAREPNTLGFEPLQALLGDGMRCEAGTLQFQFPGETVPFGMSTTAFSLITDMDVLVRRGLLDGVTDGHATLRSDSMTWTGDTISGLAIWDISAAQLALADKMATFENLAYQGRYNPGDDEDGGGQLTASSVSVYEVPFGAVDTHLRITKDSVICNSLETTFLDGDLSLSGVVDYTDPNFPGSVKVSASNLDLKRFTEVFEPPDVVLTGKVNGTADMVLSFEGLQDLHVDMTASENLTLNRSMVREILMSQSVNDAVGSKAVQKVIEKVIGNDEQRPFDKAILQLRLEDGFIRGVARLESKSLDVTVDINAEPEAILAAIRSTSESN